MNLKLHSWIAILLLGAVFSLPAADKRKELDASVNDAMGLFLKADDGMKKLFNGSVGYAIFPKVTKGGLGIGAARGTGQLFEKGRTIGEVKLTQVTIGLQAGGQIYAEVIFFENATTLKNFKEGNVEFSAQVGALAAAEGVSKNAKFEHGVLVFTLGKAGLMVEASVGGQKFDYLPYFGE